MWGLSKGLSRLNHTSNFKYPCIQCFPPSQPAFPGCEALSGQESCSNSLINPDIVIGDVSPQMCFKHIQMTSWKPHRNLKNNGFWCAGVCTWTVSSYVLSGWISSVMTQRGGGGGKSAYLDSSATERDPSSSLSLKTDGCVRAWLALRVGMAVPVMQHFSNLRGCHEHAVCGWWQQTNKLVW